MLTHDMSMTPLKSCDIFAKPRTTNDYRFMQQICFVKEKKKLRKFKRAVVRNERIIERRTFWNRLLLRKLKTTSVSPIFLEIFWQHETVVSNFQGRI